MAACIPFSLSLARKPIVLGLFFLGLIISHSFAATPTFLRLDAEDLEGEYGGELWTVDLFFDLELNTFSITNNSIVIEGISGDAAGKSYPIVEAFGNQASETEKLASFTFGPLDASANGTYEVKIVANQISDNSNPPNFVNAQTVGSFTQDITEPWRVIFEGRSFLDGDQNATYDPLADTLFDQDVVVPYVVIFQWNDYVIFFTFIKMYQCCHRKDQIRGQSSISFFKHQNRRQNTRLKFRNRI